LDLDEDPNDDMLIGCPRAGSGATASDGACKILARTMVIYGMKDHKCSSQWYYQVRMADTCYYVSKPGIHWKYKDDQPTNGTNRTRDKERNILLSSRFLLERCVSHTHQQPAHRANQNETSGALRGPEE
jgi:hypothetical protein